MKTLAWMLTGLLQSGLIGLNAWVPYVQGRATYAQSTVRRFSRWLTNDRIVVHQLYGPLMQHTLMAWGEHQLYLALDTSMLWDQYCQVRIAVIYRGRAIPLVWRVLEHHSSSISYAVYHDLLRQAAALLPRGCQVVFLADRGFADTALMAEVRRLGWHMRIRIKGNFWVYDSRGGRCLVGAIPLAPGQARFWHEVYLTTQRYGPVHLALAYPPDSAERWFVVSDEQTDWHTLDEYGLRFDIEENFLDDKSNGFQLESSQLRSTAALTRLCFVLALATLYLTVQGTAVVTQGKRRWVDPHWFRGSSYLKIGWHWVKTALVKGWALITELHLSGEPDPEIAKSSQSQYERLPQPRFAVEFVRYA
jgi:hypothetical protein